MTTRVSPGLVLALLIAPLTATAELYQWVDANGQRHFSDKPPAHMSARPRAQEEAPGEAQEAPANATRTDPVQTLPTLSVEREPRSRPEQYSSQFSNGYQPPRASEALALRQLLQDGRYDLLGERLQRTEAAVKQDIRQELALKASYEAFELEEDRWAAGLDRWIERWPNEATAYLARATYRTHQAWQARGGAYRNETPEGNFRRMTEWFDRASEDLDRARELGLVSLWAACLRISAAQANGSQSRAALALRRAIKHFPANAIARQSYLQALDPKWGGSAPAMMAFAHDTQAYADQNPNLKRLPGYAIYEAGRMAYIANDYSLARQRLDIAIDRGADHRAYYLRAKTLRRLEQPEAALADINRAIADYPDDADYLHQRARIHAKLNLLDESLNDIERAYALDPTSENIISLRRYLFSRLQHPDRELMAYTPVTGRVDQQDADALFNFAKAEIAEHRLDTAKDALDRAIELEPERFELYRVTDLVLFKQGRLELILEYWQRYLRLRPNDGRAYLERSGTYYHLHRYERSSADAKRAMELGTPGAERAYRQTQALL